jgi:enterochelin esterase family protein
MPLPRTALLAAAVLLASTAFAQTQPPASQPATRPAPSARAGRGPAAPAPRAPKGKLPILPALPADGDTAFYANNPAIPHGKIERVSDKTPAGADKPLVVYLPPSYDADPARQFPVLYLNHGGGESENHWSATTPRAGGFAHLVLDNLLAAGKARPMIIAMPNSRDLASGTPTKPGSMDKCSDEFLNAILPFIESHYRAKKGREHRALAGLSMGGFVVLNTGLAHLDTFGELYVYSSGYWPDQVAAFEENFKPLLSDPNINDQFRMPLYIAAGETDIAFANSQKTTAILNKYALRTFPVLSSGGHDWTNWRRYLHQSAQIMFPDD